MNTSQPIYVTQPSLPPLDEFVEYLRTIWDNKIITNNGPLHKQFEEELARYLGVNHISLFSNGTLALITALRALNIKGEVITTPFSFVATAHSLLWNNIIPVFVDIESSNFNIDPGKIEQAITSETTAILPVHVYGNPCEIEKIQCIADKHKLRVIYDAAHAFGVRKNNHSILNCGDLSVLSFHATKAFNTIEGGAIVSHDIMMKEYIDNLKNFGFIDEVTVSTQGINAKMNEIQAAFGLLQLKRIDKLIIRRQEITNIYRKGLLQIDGIRFFSDMEAVRHSYTYFPLIIDPDKFGHTRDDVYYSLKEDNIYCRRYFYPLISSMPMYRSLKSSDPKNLPLANKISEQIICLPLYPELENETVERIITKIKKFKK